MEEQELIQKIAYRIAVARFGKKNADALQFGNFLAWRECEFYAQVALEEIKECEIAKGALK